MKNAFTNEKKIRDNWNELSQEDEVDGLMEASQRRSQLVYKHSFSCGICRMALENLEKSFDELRALADMHFVDVKDARRVSDLLAGKLDVRHESPQVIIVQDGKAVWDESHHAIKVEAMVEVLESHPEKQ